MAQTQGLKRQYFGNQRGAPWPPDSPGDWKDLAEQATIEMNLEKLLELVNELNQPLG
jgi:hypothetical protein